MRGWRQGWGWLWGLGLLLLVVGYVACGRPGLPFPDFKDKDVHLTFLHTTDIHSRILPYRFTPGRTDLLLGLDPEKGPFGGIARIATILKEERKKSDRVVYLDSGDFSQGAPIYNVYQGEAELRALTFLGPDAIALGNHEFDNGGLILSEKLSLWSAVPILAANYVFMKDSRRETSNLLSKIARPYVILNIKGYKVGVIGLANTSSMTSLGEGGNSLGMAGYDPNTITQYYVNLIRHKVDLVVVLSHLGLTEDETLITGYYRNVKVLKTDPKTGLSHYERKWVEGIRHVDLILGGHHHVVLNPPKILIDRDGREVLLVHSGAFAKYVGRLDVVARNKEVVSYRYQAIPVTKEIAQDPKVLELMEPYVLGLNRAIDTTRVFAYAPKLVPRFGRGTGDSALGNLVAAAMKDRRRVEADFALTNSLGIRSDLQAGPVSIEQFYEIFPFENTLTTLFISGREIQEMLDFVTARSAGRGCQSQAQIAGISFVMNCALRKAEAICVGSKLNPDCKPNDPKDKVCFDVSAPSTIEGKPNPRACRYGAPIRQFTSYKMAGNDYIAKGGSGFKVLQRNTTQDNTGIPMREALIEYIETLPTCAEVNKQRQSAGRELLPVPEKYKNLPCVLSDEDGRIRRRIHK